MKDLRSARKIKAAGRLLFWFTFAAVCRTKADVPAAEGAQSIPRDASSSTSEQRPAKVAADHPVSSVIAHLGIQYDPAAKAAAPESAPPTAPLPDTLLLPTLFVNDHRGKLTEKDTLTYKGKLELAEKTTLTPLYRATFGPLGQLASYYFNFLSIFGGWHPNEADALTLYQQEERLKMLGEMDGLIRVDTVHDTKNTKQLQRVRFGAYITTR